MLWKQDEAYNHDFRIDKTGEEETVKITVIAQDGTTQDYTLIVKNKSDDCILSNICSFVK